MRNHRTAQPADRGSGQASESRRLFTSESVTEGHPDKLADQISDAVLDAVLKEDPNGRVACETLVTTGMVLVAGELTSAARDLDIPKLARDTLLAAGYDNADYGIDAETCAVLTAIDRQSPEIGAGVDRGGAGDQGMMFGYACRDAPGCMPAPIYAAHALVRSLSRARTQGDIAWLRPDGKAQVTFKYDNEMRPVAVDTVVVSAQHHDGVDTKRIEEELRARVIDPVLREVAEEVGVETEAARYRINPTGSFVRGGPHGDAGLTGRKIIVDTYGGMARHGGGAFSGKDSTKVDRSGAYAARWAAKSLVEAGAASRCEVQVAYAIGVAEPVQVFVESFGTGKRSDQVLSEAVASVFDFRPQAIIRDLDLRKPIYLKTAAYGHFGRAPATVGTEDECTRYFPWERTHLADDLKTALEL